MKSNLRMNGPKEASRVKSSISLLWLLSEVSQTMAFIFVEAVLGITCLLTGVIFKIIIGIVSWVPGIRFIFDKRRFDAHVRRYIADLEIGKS